jgi:hypothetical protein
MVSLSPLCVMAVVGASAIAAAKPSPQTNVVINPGC